MLQNFKHLIIKKRIIIAGLFFTLMSVGIVIFGFVQ